MLESVADDGGECLLLNMLHCAVLLADRGGHSSVNIIILKLNDSDKHAWMKVLSI